VTDSKFIKDGAIEKREYQVNIAKSALRGNTLVVLPTGLGKTIIALLVIDEVLCRKGGKVLFLAPTKPLVKQHQDTIRKLMTVPEDKVAIFTGEISKTKRGKLWNESQVIISTPQVIQNDLISGAISLKDVALVIFDEAHRAVGNYAYVFIAERYRAKEDHLILGITASPGGKEEKIMEIIENLGIENVEIRTEDDRDVKPYVKDVRLYLKQLPMPKELSELYNKLKELYEDIITELRKYRLFITRKKVSRKDIVIAQAEVQTQIAEGNTEYYQAAMMLNMAIKIDYALEYLETQGFESCYSYLLKIIEDGNSRGGSKASRTLVRHKKFIDTVRIARELSHKIEELENPKLHALEEILEEKLEKKPDFRAIVFTHYRETARIVEAHLKNSKKIKAVRFVGQANKGEDKGLSQKEQVEIVRKFRNGEYNVLIATSVAEEGLDIPSTDMVIFYEPIPSEIRSIQRKGRTGRTKFGEVVILSIKGTRDVAYLWSSRLKEKRMRNEMKLLRRIMGERLSGPARRIFPDDVKKDENKEESGEEEMRDDFKPKTQGEQRTLFEFSSGVVKKERMYVDTREFRSKVVKILFEDYEVVPVQLSVGDYVLSDRVAVERKTTGDFLESIRDGRLFEQVKKLKDEYRTSVLIVEGNSLFSRNFHENSIYGAIASIITDFNVPIIFTRNPEETAKLLKALHRRERAERREIALHKERKPMTLEERQRYIVESLPSVSAKLSQRLLEQFGSVRKVMNAEVSELVDVKGIGRKTAEEIHWVINEKYKKKEKQ